MNTTLHQLLWLSYAAHTDPKRGYCLTNAGNVFIQSSCRQHAWRFVTRYFVGTPARKNGSFWITTLRHHGYFQYLPCSSCSSSSLKPCHEVGACNEALVELDTGCLHITTACFRHKQLLGSVVRLQDCLARDGCIMCQGPCEGECGAQLWKCQ